MSYFYLPSFLKRCFEYFALFPSDIKFKKDELVQMWMGEGLIEVKDGTEPEEIGSQYYNDLKGRSLIQEDDMMHDMVHYLACIVSGRFSYRRNSGFCSNTPFFGSVRHAYIREKSELLIDADKLRTLIYKGDSCQEAFCYKSLRVLELQSVSDLPSSIGCDMKHLRYLRLRNFIRNSYFPVSICTLRNLQVLDLSFFVGLQNLLQDIGKLSNLRYLRFCDDSMTTLPDSVYSLSNLRVLDLSHCSCLTTLSDSIWSLSNLQVLNLYSCRKLSILPDSVCSLSNLRVLDLSHCMCLITLPNSICSLRNLQVLNLYQCEQLPILPESVCNLVNLRTLDISHCQFTTLPNDIGNLQRLQKLKISREVRLPESIVNATNLDELAVWKTNQPPHLGRLTKLEYLVRYCVGKEKGQGIDELKHMNRLKGELTIQNMDNIASVEEASMADLKSKKHIDELNFKWADSDDDEPYRKCDGEMAVRIMEVLEPHVALEELAFEHYIGHKFPGWMSSTQYHNLSDLYLRDLPMVTKMEGMVFQSLKRLWVENCPALMEISMTTPKLEELTLVKCKELKHVLSPGLWDTLKTLGCDYFRLRQYLEQMKATNASPCTKLERLTVCVGVDDGITILPVGGPNIFPSFKELRLLDLPPTNFKILSEEDRKLLDSISELFIDDCPDLFSLESLQLPLGLKELVIRNCPNLTNLPSGLRYLSSLQHFNIYKCPNLEIGPHDLLPPSVTQKYIWECPKLEEQLKREDRADWK